MKETKFKQTEVGMIPSDWECVSFNKVFVKLKSRNHQINSDEYLIIGKYPVVDQGQEPIVAYTNKNNPMEVPSSGLIVFGDHTRIFKYVDFDFFVGADGTQLITCLEGLNTKFLFYQCLCLDIPNTGYNRHFKYLKESLFVIPSSKEEQQRIANVLSDVDTLINNLEKLIAKKKNIKQGAMQQLLPGRKRLPGFGSDERRKEGHSERSAKREESSGYKMTELGMIPSDWECVSFNKVFVKLNSRNYQVNSDEYLVIGKYPVIDQGQEPIAAYTNKSNPMKVSSSGIIVFGDHTRIFKYVNFDFFVGADGTQLITCLDGLNTKFLFFQCLCLDIPNTGYNRHFKYLKESLFVIPSSIEEQTAIANVLSDMDTEISALETKLAKYRTLKTGMMQQLLTGKIRLV